jgi:hypothetical protein
MARTAGPLGICLRPLRATLLCRLRARMVDSSRAWRRRVYAYASRLPRCSQILPHYARLTAILTPCYRNVGSEVAASLIADFEQARDAVTVAALAGER